MTPPRSEKYLVALLGSRMNYAVPRILHSAGRLERLFTDLCAAKGWPAWLSLTPAPLRRAAIERVLARVPAGIPPGRITAFQWLGWQYARERARTPADRLTDVYLRTNSRFCRRIAGRNWGAASATFTFNSAGLEILAEARRRGLRTVMEQTIAPRRIEAEILAAEFASFPDWETETADASLNEFCDREEAEWALADRIVCGSEFVRDSIRQRGGPADRCRVVPYGVDLGWSPLPKPPGGRLRVLTVGTLGLRKGTPYVFEAARQLAGQAEFRMVGPIGILPQALERLRSAVEVIASVPRSELAKHYAWADVFLLPSLCEGSATVTYEALAHGLPVVATPNTGGVFRDGHEGFLVPIRDPAAIVNCLQRLHQDRELLAECSRQSAASGPQFTLGAYAERLLASLEA
jgi:glycosyltransferase involved in cell wall biosynthesis